MSDIFTIFVSNPLGSSPSRKVHLGSPLWLPTALPEPLSARICTQKLILTLCWSVHGPVLRCPGLETIFTYRNRLLTDLALFYPPTPPLHMWTLCHRCPLGKWPPTDWSTALPATGNVSLRASSPGQAHVMQDTNKQVVEGFVAIDSGGRTWR